MGEFGRTPRLRTGPPDNSIGRDHWPDAYSALVSGGGLRMGQVVGATNARGEYPTDTPRHAAGPAGHDLPPPRHRPAARRSPTPAGRPIPILHEGTPDSAVAVGRSEHTSRFGEIQPTKKGQTLHSGSVHVRARRPGCQVMADLPGGLSLPEIEA